MNEVQLRPIPMDKVGLEAGPEVKDSAAVKQMAVDTEVRNGAEYELTVKMIAQIKIQMSKVEELKDRWTKPLNEVIQDITATFKPALDNLAAAEKTLKAKAVKYADTSAQRRIELMNQAGQEAMVDDSGPATALLEEAEALEVPKIPGVSLRESWTGRVINASILPRRYLVADLKALKAVTKALKSETNIPGWRTYPAHSMAVTVAKFEEK